MILSSIVFAVSLLAAPNDPAATFPPLSAETCVNKDLSEKFGPVRNQGLAGQCFAFAAADLIGFHQGITPNKQVSVIDVSSNFLTFDPNRLREVPGTEADFLAQFKIGIGIESMLKVRKESAGKSIYERIQMGGSGDLAIAAYNQRDGICTEDQLASESTLVANDSAHFFYRRLSELGGLQTSKGFNVPPRPRITIRCPLDPQPRWAEFNDLTVRTMEDATKKACSHRLPMKKMATDMLKVPENNAFPTALLLASMIKDGVPPLLSIDANFMKEGSQVSKRPSDHAVILTGTKWDPEKKECAFKLRNSWGPDCTAYHISLRDRCEGGNLWVTASEVADRVHYITVIAAPN